MSPLLFMYFLLGFPNILIPALFTGYAIDNICCFASDGVSDDKRLISGGYGYRFPNVPTLQVLHLLSPHLWKPAVVDVGSFWE